jgi:chaperonin GroEL
MSSSNNILIDDFKELDYGFLTNCRIVSSSMGNEGRLTLLDRHEELPLTSQDGITISRNIRFSQKTQSFGSILATQGCATTLLKSGDSTSLTAVLMMNYILNMKRNEFNKAVERGMYKGVEEVYEQLVHFAKKATKKDLKYIAKVATNNDQDLANVISEAFEYATVDGIVEVIENHNLSKTQFTKQEGLKLNGHGMASAFFLNRQDKRVAFEADNVAVLISLGWDYNPNIINQVGAFYESVNGKRDTPLIIFLEKSNSEMTEKLIGIKQIGYNINLVYANGYDEFQTETMLADIASFTGATVYNPRTPDVKMVFGIADKVVSTNEDTTLIVHDVPQKFKEILKVLQKADKKDTQRIKRLTTKAALIEVTGVNPVQVREIFERVEDAVFSYKTATKEGVICGGGATLLHISNLMTTKLDNKDEQKGYNLVKTVMTTPFLQILENSNRKSSSKKTNWFTKLWDTDEHVDYITPVEKEYGVGYNASKDELSNLIEDGILDSKLSIRVAIESSLAVAIQMLSLKNIVHFPEKQYL